MNALKTQPLPNKQNGATMVEYAIMVALIAIVAIVAVTNLGTTVTSEFTTANTSISSG